MPIPSEMLSNIKDQIAQAEITIKATEDVMADLRAAGVDASKQEEEIRNAKTALRQLQLFYSRQVNR